jgi:hypothetical protein
MMTCERCERLLLDYLYGLVEDAEAQALEEHLRNCNSCTAARHQVEHWQKLLATAARDRFPTVRFTPPRFQEVSVPRSVSPRPTSPKTSASVHWLAWAVAAAIWLTGPLLLLTWDSYRQRLQTAEHDWRTTGQTLAEIENQLQQQQQQRERQLAEARRRVASTEQLAIGLLDRWLAENRKLQHASQTPLEVHGPPRLLAGVPNNLLLVWRDPRLAAGGRILAEIRDQNDAVLLRHHLDPARGERELLHIPARLWTQVKSQSELFLVLVREDERTQHRSLIQEKIRLQGPVYVTFLTTDRTRYRPGETVYFRSLTLDRVHFQPPPREQYLVFSLKDSRGRTVQKELVQTGTTSLIRTDSDGRVIPVTGPDGQPLRGVGCGAFVLPSDLPDGEYVLEVSEQRHPAGYGPQAVLPARCPLRIERGPQEQLAKRLDFLAPAFAPDSWVEAQAEVRFRGQPLSKCHVEADATVDGHLVPVELTPHGHTDEKGQVRLRFRLPPEHTLKRGDVRLQVIFAPSDGPKERIAREVPIVGRRVVVEFFPEGGHLVAGIPSRVYFRATTPAGLPVDIRGVVTDGRQAIAQVETLRDSEQPGVNRGLGVFSFTPELGRHYWLRLTEPANVSAPLLPEVGIRQISPASAAVLSVAGAAATLPRGYLLPSPETTGVVLTVRQGVTKVGEPIRVQLRAVGKPERRLVVGAYVRGTLLESKAVTVTNGQWTEVALLGDPQVTLGGVVRLTVYEDLSTEDAAADLKPVAERLVFRQSGQQLRIQTDVRGQQVNPHGFIPNSSATLHISTQDENGRPIPAILYAAVVNSADAPGPQHRLLTTHFLIAGEIHSPDGLEYADFLLSEHPKASETLDLVLGTQGWRRFREWPPQGVLSAAPAPSVLPTNHPERAEWSWMSFTSPLTAPLGKSLEEIRWQLYEQYWPPYEQAVQQWNQARHQLSELENDPRQQTILQQLHLRVLSQQEALKQMSQQWESAVQAWQPWQRVRGMILIVGILLTITCLAAAWRYRGHSLPWGVSTLGLILFLIPGMWLFLEVDKTLMAAAQFEQGSHTKLSATKQEEGGQLQSPAAPTMPSDSKQKMPTNDASPEVKDKKDNLGAWQITPLPKGPSTYQPPPPHTNLTPTAPPAYSSVRIAPRPDNNAQQKSEIFAPSAPSPPAAPLSGSGPPGSQAVAGTQDSTSKSPPLGGRAGALAPFSKWDGQAGGVVGTPTRRETVEKARIASIPLDPASRQKVVEAEHLQRLRPGTGKVGEVDAQPVFGASDRGEAQRNAVQGVDREVLRRLQEREEIRLSQALAAAFANDVSRSRAQMLQQGWELRQQRTPQDAPQVNAVIPPPLDRPSGRKVTPQAGSNESASDHADGSPEERQLSLLQSLQVQPPPLVIREYAPTLPATHEIADTLLWMPVIIVPENGQVQLPLRLGTAQGGYDLIVAGHTLNGRLGAIRTSLPLASPVPTR